MSLMRLLGTWRIGLLVLLDRPGLRNHTTHIVVAKIETIVEPDGVANDIRRESVALASVHVPILLKLST